MVNEVDARLYSDAHSFLQHPGSTKTPDTRLINTLHTLNTHTPHNTHTHDDARLINMLHTLHTHTT